jgi:hypothetical protein
MTISPEIDSGKLGFSASRVARMGEREPSVKTQLGHVRPIAPSPLSATEPHCLKLTIVTR